jgi:hypothetical protein
MLSEFTHYPTTPDASSPEAPPLSPALPTEFAADLETTVPPTYADQIAATDLLDGQPTPSLIEPTASPDLSTNLSPTPTSALTETTPSLSPDLPPPVETRLSTDLAPTTPVPHLHPDVVAPPAPQPEAPEATPPVPVAPQPVPSVAPPTLPTEAVAHQPTPRPTPQPEQQPQPALPQDHDPQLPEQPEQPERSQPAATPEQTVAAATPSEDEQPPATQTGDNMGNGPTDPPDGVHSAEGGEGEDGEGDNSVIRRQALEKRAAERVVTLSKTIPSGVEYSAVRALSIANATVIEGRVYDAERQKYIYNMPVISRYLRTIVDITDKIHREIANTQERQRIRLADGSVDPEMDEAIAEKVESLVTDLAVIKKFDLPRMLVMATQVSGEMKGITENQAIERARFREVSEAALQQVVNDDRMSVAKSRQEDEFFCVHVPGMTYDDEIAEPDYEGTYQIIKACEELGVDLPEDILQREDGQPLEPEVRLLLLGHRYRLAQAGNETARRELRDELQTIIGEFQNDTPPFTPREFIPAFAPLLAMAEDIAVRQRLSELFLVQGEVQLDMHIFRDFVEIACAVNDDSSVRPNVLHEFNQLIRKSEELLRENVEQDMYFEPDERERIKRDILLSEIDWVARTTTIDTANAVPSQTVRDVTELLDRYNLTDASKTMAYAIYAREFTRSGNYLVARALINDYILGENWLARTLTDSLTIAIAPDPLSGTYSSANVEALIPDQDILSSNPGLLPIVEAARVIITEDTDLIRAAARVLTARISLDTVSSPATEARLAWVGRLFDRLDVINQDEGLAARRELLPELQSAEVMIGYSEQIGPIYQALIEHGTSQDYDAVATAMFGLEHAGRHASFEQVLRSWASICSVLRSKQS